MHKETKKGTGAPGTPCVDPIPVLWCSCGDCCHLRWDSPPLIYKSDPLYFSLKLLKLSEHIRISDFRFSCGSSSLHLKIASSKS